MRGHNTVSVWSLCEARRDGHYVSSRGLALAAVSESLPANKTTVVLVPLDCRTSSTRNCICTPEPVRCFLSSSILRSPSFLSPFPSSPIRQTQCPPSPRCARSSYSPSFPTQKHGSFVFVGANTALLIDFQLSISVADRWEILVGRPIVVARGSTFFTGRKGTGRERHRIRSSN